MQLCSQPGYGSSSTLDIPICLAYSQGWVDFSWSAMVSLYGAIGHPDIAQNLAQFCNVNKQVPVKCAGVFLSFLPEVKEAAHLSK